jgi:hypothetical protein
MGTGQILFCVTLEIILRDSLVDILRAATSSAPDEVLPL